MRTALRTSGFVIGALLVGGLVACGRDASKLNDDLAKDLQNASSSQGSLTLAPVTSKSTQTVSAIERSRLTASAPARSQRVAVYHRKRTGTSIAPVASTEANALPAPVEAPTTAPQTAAAPTPQPGPPTPTPGNVSGPTPSNGGDGTANQPGNGAGRDDGDGIGNTVGSVLGAILRGGVVDGDHCDPRGGHRRGGIISEMPGGVIGGGSGRVMRGGQGGILRYDSPTNPSVQRTTVLRGASY